MLKATSLLITHRQEFSKSTVKVVKVEKIGGGNANECFNNALVQIDKDKSLKIASGWVVLKVGEAFSFLPHFWNSDAQGNYFDTTPHSYEGVYVLDIELLKFGQKHIKNIKSRVVCPIVLKNGVWHSIAADDSVEPYKILTSLHPKNLFEFS
jgi:hypothetical protein